MHVYMVLLGIETLFSRPRSLQGVSTLWSPYVCVFQDATSKQESHCLQHHNMTGNLYEMGALLET